MSDRRRRASRDASEFAAEHADARYAELRLLAEEHRSGHVSDREFERGKRRILAGADGDRLASLHVEMIVATYADEDAAEEALCHLRQLQDDGELLIRGAAVVVREASGRIQSLEVRELAEQPDARRSSAGTDALPACEAERRPVAVDATAHAWAEGRLRADELAAIGARLQLGHSAIIAVVHSVRIGGLPISAQGYEAITRDARTAELTRVLAFLERSVEGDSDESLSR